MKRNELKTALVASTAAILILLLVIEDCQGGPSPSSKKSVASSLLRRRGSKSKSSSPSSVCMLPPVTPGAATCFASFRRWTYSVGKGKCEEIYYGGCFGTKNLFDSLDECTRACGGVQA